jgi:hypothetical protein
MKLSDFNLLKKLLNMTESPVDAEALAAIRKANDLLKRADVNWDRVMNRMVTLDVEMAGAGTSAGAGDVEEDDMESIFQKAIDQSSGGFHETILSIYAQWQRTSSISARQREVVLKAASGDGRR